MAWKVDYLDCCSNPLLESVKAITKDDHDHRTLCRCQTCGAFWFTRFYEYIYFDVDLPDSQIHWHVRLTEEEAAAIQESGKRVRIAGRLCFQEDEGVVVKTGYPLF